MPEKIKSEARNRLYEHSCRFTGEREAILEALVLTDGRHPTADEIYLATKPNHPNIGLATVYRTLDLFSQVGIVSKSDLGGDSARYELSPVVKAPQTEEPGHFHHHLVCLRCGKVTEFREDLLEELERAIASRTGFKVVDHSLKFYGLCEECQKQAAES